MSKMQRHPSALLRLIALGLALAAGHINTARAQQPVPAPVSQGRFVIALGDLQYSHFGETTIQRNSRGAWLLTLDQLGTATAACGGNAACDSLGIHGAQIHISQDLQIIIDLVGAGVVALSGRTRGTLRTTIEERSLTADFRGNVSGEANCDSNVCGVRMTLHALTQDGAALTLELLGTIEISEDSANWSSLGGVGQIAVGPGIFRYSADYYPER